MRLLIVQTGSPTTPDVLALGDYDALFRAALGGVGERATVTRPYQGQPLPNPEEYQAVLITGSPAMVSAREPWSEKTAQWLKAVVAAGVPTLGVCYGHQLLAHALGGQVGPNPRGPEYGAITLTEADAGSDPLFRGTLQPGDKVFTAHSETVLSLPKGAVAMAKSLADEHQAVRYARAAWGVQFHPEFTAPFMTALLNATAKYLGRHGIDVEAAHRSVPSVSAHHGRRLLARFAELAGA
jgi:GMP synthase (glutamine-hydrolysing)